MRFIVNKTNCGSLRTGIINGFFRSPGAVIETPGFALLTQGGSVVHLTAEVLAQVFPNPKLLWLPLSNSYFLENGVKAQGEGVAKFVGLPEHIICVTVNNMNMATPSGHLEADTIPLWTKQGKKMIGANRYMDLMECFKPDLILAIADSKISLNESNKRISKSVDRTCAMLDKCVEIYNASEELKNSSLIGIIVGAADEKKSDACLQRILAYKETLAGVALSGLTDGSDESFEVLHNNLDAVFKRIGAILPKEMLRLVEGCWNPIIIMSAIEHGWDVFDGSFVVKLTNAGRALALSFDIYRHTDTDQLCVLDLNDIRYKDDFGPTLAGCECLTCRKHKRAYIRHLLNTREMLASILLSIHNLHNFEEMFRLARQHIAAGSFPAYKTHITAQYERYLRSSADSAECVDDGNKKDIPVKKKRLSSEDISADIVNGTF